MEIVLPFFDRSNEQATLGVPIVGEGQKVGWAEAVGRVETSVGPVPFFAPVGGTIRWWQKPGDIVTAGSVIGVVEPDPPATEVEPADTGSPTRAVLLVAYFGKLPRMFPLFARSCASNAWLDVKILTDAPAPLELPANVKIFPSSLDDVGRRVKQYLGVEPILPRPYKMCDLKPMYAEIFPEHVEGYGWWGYGDLDVVYGTMQPFLEAGMRGNYAMLLRQGSFCLMRNSPQMRKLYRHEFDGTVTYREVLTDPISRVFDEGPGVQQFLQRLNIPCWRPPMLAEIGYPPTQLRLGTRFSREINFDDQVFTWRDGRLYREFWQESTLRRRELGLIHLQKRPIHLMPDAVLSTDSFAFTTFGFEPLEDAQPSPRRMKQLNPSNSIYDFVWTLAKPYRRAKRLYQEARTRRKYRPTGLA